MGGSGALGHCLGGPLAQRNEATNDRFGGTFGEQSSNYEYAVAQNERRASLEECLLIA